MVYLRIVNREGVFKHIHTHTQTESQRHTEIDRQTDTMWEGSVLRYQINQLPMSDPCMLKCHSMGRSLCRDQMFTYLCVCLILLILNMNLAIPSQFVILQIAAGAHNQVIRNCKAMLDQQVPNGLLYNRIIWGGFFSG